jgi:hypothetical protein
MIIFGYGGISNDVRLGLVYNYRDLGKDGKASLGAAPLLLYSLSLSGVFVRDLSTLRRKSLEFAVDFLEVIF